MKRNMATLFTVLVIVLTSFTGVAAPQNKLDDSSSPVNLANPYVFDSVDNEGRGGGITSSGRIDEVCAGDGTCQERIRNWWNDFLQLSYIQYYEKPINAEQKLQIIFVDDYRTTSIDGQRIITSKGIEKLKEIFKYVVDTGQIKLVFLIDYKIKTGELKSPARK